MTQLSTKLSLYIGIFSHEVLFLLFEDATKFKLIVKIKPLFQTTLGTYSVTNDIVNIRFKEYDWIIIRK